MVVVPRVPGGSAREVDGMMVVERFRYFPSRWEDLADGAIIENLRARPSRWLQVLPFMICEGLAIRRAVRKFAPDALHVHWIIPQGILALLVARRIPMLVTTLGGDLYALNSAPLRWLKSRVVTHARHVTVMNQEMKERVEALGAAPDSVTVLPMGADLEAIRLVERLPLGHDDPLRLLFVGRLVEKKGLTVLLEALRRLSPMPVRLTVVGDGPLRALLEQQAVGLPVQFVGQLGRALLAEQYACHDVVIAPSLVAGSGDKDGLPVALVEAMGAGCAVIASDLPGLNEIVVDGLNGLLVRSGAADELAAAIAGLAADHERVVAFGAGARRAADELSIDSVAQRYRALLRDVVP